MNVNGASTSFEHASWILSWHWNADNQKWTHQQTVLAKMLVTISCPPPWIEHPQSVNRFCGGLKRYTAMNCIVLYLNRVVRGQSLQSDLVYHFTNMLAMSYRSDFLTCSSRVNIEEPVVCFTVWLSSAVFRVGLPKIPIPAAKSDSRSLNTSLLEVMISYTNEWVIICDLSDVTLQIIFHAWWGSTNLSSKASAKHIPFGQNGSILVDALCRSRQRHPGGGLFHARHQYNASRCISPSDHCLIVSSCSVGPPFQTITLALWPTVTIRRNGFIGSALASGL